MEGTIEIRHRPEQERFETELDGHHAVLNYRLAAGCMVIDHVGVAPAIEGRGIAGRLTQAALAWARLSGVKVRPLCSYAAAWMRRHPDCHDLHAD